MTLDRVLWLAGDTVTLVVVALLFGRGMYRTFPVFTSYLVWGLFSDAGLLATERYFSGSYALLYLLVLSVDSLFQFGVLVELAWSVLRPVRTILSRWSLPAIVLLMALASAIVWSLSAWLDYNSITKTGRLIDQIEQTFSILRVLFFLLLAAFSQLLSIGWRDRELQVATGFGFYSVVSLVVWMQHRSGPQHHFLEQLIAFSYICSLGYWVFCFTQKEAERRAFTPQMQGFLLSVAGGARGTRMALVDSGIDKPHRKRDS